MARLISDDALAIVTIWQEARGESQDGKVAVAEVIRNRIQQRYSSSGSVASTVLRPFQFSGWNSNTPWRAASTELDDADPVVAECAAAWQTAQGGSNTVSGAVLYYNPAAVPAEPPWVLDCDEVAVVGAHHFFVPKPQ
jgi:spore germination cell wall hydrolase CwlJ-like protein